MNSPVSFLEADRCCLLVIDPQEKLLATVHKPEKMIRNTALLIRCARALDIPVLATTQYKKGLGPFVPELDELLTGVPCPDKTHFNSFANGEFRGLVDKLLNSVDTMLLAGAEAHICIYQTALGALQAGFNTWVISDAVSSRNKKNIGLALDRLGRLGASVGPAEMVIYELLREAGTPPFKAMLPYLK
jgi:nicotinamidase-related amidase